MAHSNRIIEIILNKRATYEDVVNIMGNLRNSTPKLVIQGQFLLLGLKG